MMRSSKRRRLLLVITVGAAGIAAAATLFFIFSGESSGKILLAALAAFASVSVAAVSVWLNDPGMEYISRSDIRRTKVSKTWFWYSEAGSRPEFFRAPPCFIDFQKNYVVQHPMVASIVGRALRSSSGAIIVEAAPASGKSIVLRTTEYYLRTSWRRLLMRRIYVISCKTILTEAHADAVCKEIKENVPPRSIVIIDDLHLHLLRLATTVASVQGKKIFFIIMTRPLSNYPASVTYHLRGSQFERDQTEAGVISQQIIQKYLTSLGCHTAENVSKFKPYENDLWVLCSALKSSELRSGSISVSDERLYTWINNELIGSDEVTGEPSRRTVMIALACLYRFEIPMDPTFLSRDLAIDRSALDELKSAGDILHDAGTVRLHHSSLAGLILAATNRLDQNMRLPTAITSVQIDAGGSWEDSVIASYVEKMKPQSLSVLVQLARASEDGLSLATRIAARTTDISSQLLKSVKSGSLPLDGFGTLMRVWRLAHLERYDVVRQCCTAYTKESDGATVAAVCWAVVNLVTVDDRATQILVPRLASAMPHESIEEAARIATTLSYLSQPVAEASLAGLNQTNVAGQLRRLDGSSRAMTLAKIVWVKEELGAEVCNWSDFTSGVERDDIPQMLARIAWGSASFASTLVDNTPTERLERSVRTMPDDKSKIELCGVLANISPPVGVKVATNLLDLTGPQGSCLTPTVRLALETLIGAPFAGTKPIDTVVKRQLP